MTYTISTSRDSSLFFEVPDPDTDAAPQRVAAGTTLTCYDTASGQQTLDLTVQSGGYADGRWPCPRIDVDTGADRVTVYSAEWIATRGEGGACAYWTEGVNLPSDPALLQAGDLCLMATGVSAKWDGSQWTSVAVSGGGTGGVVVTPTPADPTSPTTPTTPTTGGDTTHR